MLYKEKAKALLDDLQALLGDPRPKMSVADLNCGSLGALDTIITPTASSFGRPCPRTTCPPIHTRISTHMTHLRNIASARGISANLRRDGQSIFCQLIDYLNACKKYDIQLILDALTYVVNTLMATCNQVSTAMESRSLSRDDLKILRNQVHECSVIVSKIRTQEPYFSPSIINRTRLDRFGA